jgi:hypothetical protein
MDYTFGYGSLINSFSREKTGETGQAFPVVGNDFQRAWDFAVPGQPVTALGVYLKEGAETNGVVVEVSKKELLSFDAKEADYQRASVSSGNGIQ